MRHARHVVLALVATGVIAADGAAIAQDRLFTQTLASGTASVELGAIGHFGEVLRPAPPGLNPFPSPVFFYAVFATVVDATTGVPLWTAGPGEQIAAVTAAHDRSVVFVQTVESGPAAFVQRLRAIAGTSGTVLGDVVGGFDSVTWDPIGRRLLAWSHDRAAFDVFTEHLALLGRVPLGASGSRCWRPAVWISPYSGRAYIALGQPGPTIYDNRALLLGVDLVRSQIVGAADLGSIGSNPCPSLLLWSVPATPVGMAASVTGHEVALSWIPAEYASGYALDVGGAPGRTDLTIYLGNLTALRFANVPAGTYYLRVRGGNSMGGGRPSSEVRVVVP